MLQNFYLVPTLLGVARDFSRASTRASSRASSRTSSRSRDELYKKSKIKVA